MNETKHVQYKVISDVHLWHRNILEYCDRPYVSVESMSNHLMDRLVDQSREEDVLWFLGDLSFQLGTYKDWLFERLSDMQGSMRWILGNHDDHPDKNGTFRRMERLVSLFDFVGHADSRLYAGKHVFFSHYPLDIPNVDTGRLVSIHGHTHGSIPNPIGRIDVGVDNLFGLRNHPDTQDILKGYNFDPISLKDAVTLASRDLPSPYGDRVGKISF